MQAGFCEFVKMNWQISGSGRLLIQVGKEVAVWG